MKTEDIDKRIGMPDVDKEWARFEQEVIDPHQQSPSMGRTKRKPLPHRGGRVWKGGLLGVGIAASVALLLIFNIGKEQTEQPLVAQVQPARPEHVSELARMPAKEVVAKVSKPVATPRKELALAKADASATTGLDIPAREYTGLVQKSKEDGLDSGTTMRLRGTGVGPSDKDRIDSTLILVNGEPLPDSLKHKIMGNDMDDIDTYMPRYFSQQGLMIDSVYVHKDSEFTTKYGGRAKYGVIEITTVPGNQEELLATLPDFVPDENEVRLLPQGVIGGSHDSTPNDSILYLVNGEPQPKENNKWLGRRSYLDYFKGQHMLVTRVIRHQTEDYVEKYGEAAKHGVIEYICVEDTLCDYYMDQHEELKASRRRVTGVVYDENDEPLEHTMIHIFHDRRIWGTETTDSTGHFVFWVPRTDATLHFKYIGYKAVVVEATDMFHTIYLLPEATERSMK